MAQSFLCSQSAFDLELAFRGEARGVFSWLQCLVMEEEEWCTTRGCPACVVTHVLHSEPTIRLILAACRLSRSLRKQSKEHGYPLFDFWRSSLRKVVDRDPFWGPTQAKGIEERAEQLEWGIQELILQCHELSDMVQSTEEVPETFLDFWQATVKNTLTGGARTDARNICVVLDHIAGRHDKV
ncbi:hypothetical protein MMC27_001757 [Xylographa pallens]|nr:hypothetical protein [Xylographa pallens]